MKLLDEQIKTNEEYLEIVTIRFRRGQVPATDVLQQRQLLESKRGEKVRVESEIAVLKHQLAILLGRAPGTLEISAGDELPELPPLPGTGVPAEWIQRRPDIRSAYLRVQADDQRVAAAIADRFPKVGLSASASTSSERVRDLFDNWFASVAAGFVVPLVDGGRRRAEVTRTRAAASESLHLYGQTVLDSLKEVEDALTREAHQRALLASLEKQLDLSQKSTDQTRDRYAKGTMDFLRFLTTLLNHQTLQRTYLQAQQELVQFRINLYRSLSGSWQLQRSDMKMAARGRAAARGGASDAVHYEGDSENVTQ
jgi:outer membrane protein TolC